MVVEKEDYRGTVTGVRLFQPNRYPVRKQLLCHVAALVNAGEGLGPCRDPTGLHARVLKDESWGCNPSARKRTADERDVS
jgi:hypothetical protein